MSLAELIESQIGLDEALAQDTVSRATRITVNGEPYTGDIDDIADVYSGMQFTIYSLDRNVTVNFV